jgi:hypothetical protein
VRARDNYLLEINDLTTEIQSVYQSYINAWTRYITAVGRYS